MFIINFMQWIWKKIFNLLTKTSFNKLSQKKKSQKKKNQKAWAVLQLIKKPKQSL